MRLILFINYTTICYILNLRQAQFIEIFYCCFAVASRVFSDYILLNKMSFFAGVTQLVECQLPKLNVASSNLVARSERFPSPVLTKLAEQVSCQNEDPRSGKHSLRSCAESGLDVVPRSGISRSSTMAREYNERLSF